MIGCPGPPPNPIYETTPTYSFQTQTNFTEQPYNMESLPPWDFTTLINLDNFNFKILNNKLCNNDSIIDVLVLIHSAPDNIDKRNTIRQTWGEQKDNIKIVFLFGEVKDFKKQNELEMENNIFGDIIQGNFVDAYRNMTYKHVMALKYAVYFCQQAKFIMKTDDDTFVNMPAVLTFLNSDYILNARKLLLCAPFYDAKVKRSYRSKWRMSFKEYRDKYYPPYCPGYALLYSPDIVFKLYREAQRSEYFWIDDVYITGILAKRINLTQTSIENFVLSKKQVYQLIKYNGTFIDIDQYLYGPPDLTQDSIKNLWNIVKFKNFKHNR